MPGRIEKEKAANKKMERKLETLPKIFSIDPTRLWYEPILMYSHLLPRLRRIRLILP